MAKKEKVNVERIGKNTGRPITSAPVPVRETMIGSNAPYYIDSNGTIIESVVDNDGVNTQTFYRSNLVPSFKLKIRHDGVNTPDTLGVYNYTDPQSFIAYDKLKPGSKEYTEVVKKSKQYNVPLATYNEASANFEEVKNQAQHLQPGGSIASRLWNKWTGKDTYTDGYGTTRSHVPVKESAHRTALKAADSPLVQAIPVVGDIADGYVAADYAAKGNYKPAMAAIGAGLILPNAMEVGARMVPSSTYRTVADKVDDAIEILDVEDNLGRKYVQKNGEWVPENTDEIKVLGVEKPSRWNRASDKRFNAVEDNSDRWIPETQYDDDLNVIAGSLDDSMSTEPWWGWDPVEYQKGGNLPSDDQQQQLFVAIITDMAATLGVEPSQEFAEAVLTAFEKQDDSQGLITLFTKTKDKFMNETGLFREGGKMFAFVEKFKCGGKAKKTSKKQMGGEVEDAGAAYMTTPVNDRKMRRAYRDRTGASRAEARQVQRDLANNIASQGGISGRGAMNSAAAMMGDPQRFAQPQESRVLGGVSTPTLNVPTPQMGTPASLEHNYDNFDFNTAFGRARGNGEDTFMWRGKEYTTELAQPRTQTVPDMASQTAGGVYPEYYRNNLQNAGAEWEWGKKFRANRAEKQRLKDEIVNTIPGANRSHLVFDSVEDLKNRLNQYNNR